jgi:hypothetical protein
MNNKFRTLITLVSLATASILATSNSAQAISLYYEPPTGNVYTLGLELDNDESISDVDTLVLNGLSGVSDIDDSFGVYVSSGFAPNLPSYSLNVATGYTATGATTILPVLKVTSSTPLNLATYDATFSNNGTPDLVFNANPQAVTSSAVPFEFSPGVGLVLFASAMGINYWRHRNNSIELLDNK